MVKLNRLLGHRPEVHVACMYTKHKTQKKKTWHDGFVSLYASRRVVLYDEMPPDGTLPAGGGRASSPCLTVLC
ncbi:TPA: hypothetical protein N0F65_005814 [Lagenidium giganteum]|uniref:5'-3' DNA helicase ZGRF1-like N-terminal domain-containing protein n=1 Tax=Lagenidium giganteum TaxID=4803 RepID=A0AAV2YNT6_9STRA|nr:TPA: hypothetical protein N0F65_005814 [Lagenidium giganteum]